ncbi:MAG: Amuc_1099 family pilus-like system protein [Luteolibacter sp.]
MSWFSENYEKAAVGVAAVAALGLAYAGWSKLGSVEETFSDTPRGAGDNDSSVVQADAVSTAIATHSHKREWVRGDDKGRPVDLFTGVSLFVNKNDPNNPVDLGNPAEPPVHPPIPNQWWIDNRVDPGFGDSPQQDADDDGFTNLEEFEAETDPMDPDSYPALITKLSYIGDESVQWVLRPGFPAGEGYTFDYNDTAGQRNRVTAASPAQPGDMLFAEDPLKNRFKYIGFEERQVMDERLNTNVKTNFVKVEDQKPNKKGMIYEIPGGFRKANAAKFSKYDRTAVLSLEALGLSGQEIKVEEFSSFALPSDAKEKNFKLIEVTPESITVEVTSADGEKSTHQISKGSVGP